MRNTITPLYGLLWVTIALFMGCAGSNNVTKAPDSSYTEDVGLATVMAAEREIELIFRQHGYAILRYSTDGGVLYMETEWKERKPLEDETQQGAVAARTRLIIRSRARSTTNSAGQLLHAIELRTENEYKKTPVDDWSMMALTPQARRHALDLGMVIRRELIAKGGR